MLKYPKNVVLLLLQIILERQQFLSHSHSSQQDSNKYEYDELLKQPIIDQEILNEFVDHRVVKMNAPELADIQLRSLKTLVLDIFEEGIPDEKEINVISLANYYYYERIKEIETVELPELSEEIRKGLKS